MIAAAAQADHHEFEALVEEYGLGKLVEARPRHHGWSPRGNRQVSFFVDTSRGRFVVRRDEVKGELDVKREIDLLLYLRKHGFPCPQPVLDRKGRTYRESGGVCVFVQRWIEGRSRPVEQLAPAQVESVGRYLGELHVVGKGYKKGIENRYNFERVSDLWGALRSQLPPYFRKITRTLDEEVEYLGSYLELKLPKGVIHGGLHRTNVLVRNGKVAGLLDFEAACRAKLIYDLAIGVNAVCFAEGRYDLKRFEALIAGYESVRTLSLAEWDAFPNELRFAALRFTVTRLRDLLALPGAEKGLAAITEERARPGAEMAADRPLGVVEERAHSTAGFLEFFDRLSILRREREGGMESMLLAMATGYDYRRYQKVKAIEKKGTK